jgi:hypothetical protein
MPNEETIAAPPDELYAERKQVERDHLCDCETCRRSGAICPASAGTLINELAQKRIALRRLVSPVAPNPQE